MLRSHSISVLHIVVPAILLLTIPQIAKAQCENWDARFGVPLGVDNNSIATIGSWDPDGPGPVSSQIIIGGSFRNAGGSAARMITRWDGSRWQAFGQPSNSLIGERVSALTTWDVDGPGPQFPSLVAAGNFYRNGPVPISNIAHWNGSDWIPFGTGIDGEIHAVTTWDPDGPGPLPSQLIAGGRFLHAGGIWAFSIASWDGSAWHPVGSGFGSSETVGTLLSWDPDGPGPTTPQLVAGGAFRQVGSLNTMNIARWNGSVWTAFDTGLSSFGSGSVESLAAWDPDGLRPAPESLIACGNFVEGSNISIRFIARWTGALWAPMGTPGVNVPSHVFTWDADGDGPVAPRLLVYNFERLPDGVTVRYHLHSWDGSAWQRLADTTSNLFPRGFSWDLDGPGPETPKLISAALSGQNLHEATVTQLNGSSWETIDRGIDDTVTAITPWQHNPADVLPTALIASGHFGTTNGDRVCNHIAEWAGSQWHALGSGLNSGANALLSWDPDGVGPSTRILLAGGDFTTAGGLPISFLATWDGTNWRKFSGGGVNGRVNAFTLWDPHDPTHPGMQLVVGGNFTSAGGKSVSFVARWDGENWHPLGKGVNGEVLALTTWDPDGLGPEHALLVIGGLPRFAGDVTINRIGAWDGRVWRPFGVGLNAEILALASFDSDGPGPELAQLVAGGYFTRSGTDRIQHVARWNGSRWVQLGTGVNGSVRAFQNWPPDTSLETHHDLIVLGDLSGTPEFISRGAVRWDGSAFHPFANGPSNNTGSHEIYAVAPWTPPESDDSPVIVVGGMFREFAGQPAGYIGVFRYNPPALTSQPQDLRLSPGQNAEFAVSAQTGPLTFQWRHNGVTLDSISNPSASTELLILSSVRPNDSGVYDCLVANSCGETISHVATLSVCTVDFNHDNAIDFFDYLDFVQAFASNDPAADFNNDSNIDFFDYLAFVQSFSTGC